RLLGRLERGIGRRLRLVRDVPLADAAALHDPRVVGLDDLLEVGVREDPFRRIRADPDDLGPRHSRPPSRPPRASSASSAARMCSLSPFFAHSPATRTAFLMALAGDRPWQMIASTSPTKLSEDSLSCS